MKRALTLIRRFSDYCTGQVDRISRAGLRIAGRNRVSASEMHVSISTELTPGMQLSEQSGYRRRECLELAGKGIAESLSGIRDSGMPRRSPDYDRGGTHSLSFLAIRYDYEPLLLIPIGIGIIFGNIPFFQAEGVNMQIGIYQEGSVLNYLYFGVLKGVYPPLIFLGIGAMTDFSSLISKPKLMLLGAAAQVGIFLTFLGALALGFHPQEAGAIGIIGGADGPTAIFLVLQAGQRGGYYRYCTPTEILFL